jgi:hypothetical protein
MGHQTFASGEKDDLAFLDPGLVQQRREGAGALV